jgi:hypothetical protein
MHRATLKSIVFMAAVELACNNPLPPPQSQTLQPTPTQQLPGQPVAAQPVPAQPVPAQPAPVQYPNGAAGSSAGMEFIVPPLAAGYQRFEATPIEIPAGGSDQWAQWVGGPLDQDYDILDITGVQSFGGHHALVYAHVDAEPAGFTRLWKDEDQITTRLMGGLGGEGGANVNLPPGIVFRVKKGSYIVLQTHYLNTLDRQIVGRTVMDVKLSPVDPSRRVASIMSNTSLAINLPPHAQTGMDINCAVQHDLQFLQISNHMHDYGTTTLSEFIDPQGVKHVIKDDTAWHGDLALNPNFTMYSPAAPLIVPKGSMLHTHCTWNNTTANDIRFPAEMCVFFGFVLNESDIYCTDGKWSEITNSATPPSAGAGPLVTAGVSGSAGAAGGSTSGAAGGMAGAAGTGAAAAVGCTSTADQTIMTAAAFDGQSTDCAIPCAFDPDVATCTTPCFERTVGLSHACAACNATNIACGSKNCRTECLLDSASEACRSCVNTKCDPAFRMCTGT